MKKPRQNAEARNRCACLSTLPVSTTPSIEVWGPLTTGVFLQSPHYRLIDVRAFPEGATPEMA
jgi:hypothetical protein